MKDNQEQKSDKPLIQVNDLYVQYVTDDNVVKAVNGASFELNKGETMGLVGETGAGKTTTAMSVMQLIPDPPGIITGGDIFFKGKSLLDCTEKEKQHIRGKGISMIFQDPMTALNPTMTIGKQMIEVYRKHTDADKKEAEKVCMEFMEKIGVRRERFNDYPHQLSGGMKQRVVIAMALLCQPELLIADEPTTALDVTIQAQVLEIIKSLVDQMGMSMILITHDLGVVAETCNKVSIMYAGEIIESGTVLQVYKHPKHPYTKGLFDSLPKIDEDESRLKPILGSTPNPADLPAGCKFHPRCPYFTEMCKTEIPPIREDEKGHTYRCHLESPIKEAE